METLRLILRVVAAMGFVGAGAWHFVHFEFFKSIVPASLPVPGWLVIISGIAEIAGGVGLLVTDLRVAAGWGLIALLLAVFPANVSMAMHPERFPNFTPWMLWARLPFQAVFIAWVWFVSNSPPAS